MHTRTIRTAIVLLSLSASLVAIAPAASAHVPVEIPRHCVFNDSPGGIIWLVEQASSGAVDFHRCSVIVHPENLPEVPPVGAPPLPEGLCDDVEFLLFEPDC